MKHRARKRFGQHFLVDPTVLQNIANLVPPSTAANLIEIGPGTGALSQYLMPLTPYLYAIEIDRDLVQLLSQQFNNKPLTIIEDDVLNISLKNILKQHDNLTAPLTIVGNLPYNISTPLLFHLFSQIDLIEQMIFMVQKEIAYKLTAQPGDKNFGRLSLMASLYANTTIRFDVPASAFAPPPKVTSSVMTVTPKKETATIANRQLFDQLVNQAFSQRRKTIGNSLKKWLSISDFEHLNIDPKSRPQTLSAETFITISDYIKKQEANN